MQDVSAYSINHKRIRAARRRHLSEHRRNPHLAAAIPRIGAIVRADDVIAVPLVDGHFAFYAVTSTAIGYRICVRGTMAQELAKLAGLFDKLAELTRVVRANLDKLAAVRAQLDAVGRAAPETVIPIAAE